MSVLELFLHEDYVGTVTPNARDRSRVALTVDDAYRGAVVLTEGFTTAPGMRPNAASVSNFLGGYVPEGNHRDKMAAKRHVDAGDLFALLTEFGGSVAGAGTLRKPEDQAAARPEYQALTDRELGAKLKQALEESDQGLVDDSRSTLAGYQPKLLVARVDEQWAYPRRGAHSTWILKPQVPARPSRLFDEHYSHLLAQHVGLSEYRSEIGKAGRMTYLAIERFDRETVDGAVRLVHQEDLAQALGLDWTDTEAKFQAPAWPGRARRASARGIGELLGSIPGGEATLAQWIQQLTFNVVIGNNDAHAKNVALLHTPIGTSLAPLYDAVPNLFQEGLIKFDLALAIDGVFDHRRISAERIIAEAAGWGVIARSRAETIVNEVLAAIATSLAAVRAPRQISEGLAERLHWNVERLLAGAEISEPKRR